MSQVIKYTVIFLIVSVFVFGFASKLQALTPLGPQSEKAQKAVMEKIEENAKKIEELKDDLEDLDYGDDPKVQAEIKDFFQNKELSSKLTAVYTTYFETKFYCTETRQTLDTLTEFILESYDRYSDFGSSSTKGKAIIAAGDSLCSSRSSTMTMYETVCKNTPFYTAYQETVGTACILFLMYNSGSSYE